MPHARLESDADAAEESRLVRLEGWASTATRRAMERPRLLGLCCMLAGRKELQRQQRHRKEIKQLLGRRRLGRHWSRGMPSRNIVSNRNFYYRKRNTNRGK